MAALAKELGVGYFGLSDNKDAKSGNYNNALNQTSSPLVATFDADMIPYSEFLLETVPYFVEQVEADANDEELDKAPIGLIQTPQSFYNEDIFQYHLFSEGTLPNEQDFFSKGINNFNSACGSAFYTGSNTVLYRKAIDDAGGFPTDTITEDFELGARMNIEGYVNYSTDAPMASGLTRLAMRDVSKEYRTQIWGEIVETIFAPYLTMDVKLDFVSYDKEANKSLYQVTNLASLAKTPQFKQLASEWKGQVA